MNKLVSAIAYADSAFCKSYKVAEPKSNFVFVSSKNLVTESKFLLLASSDFS